jgi:hypothetical protein
MVRMISTAMKGLPSLEVQTLSSRLESSSSRDQASDRTSELDGVVDAVGL